MKVRDAAERLGVTPDSVRHWIRAGRLDAIKDSSGFYVVNPESVESFTFRTGKSLPLAKRVGQLERRVKELETLVLQEPADHSHETVVEETEPGHHTPRDPIDGFRQPPRQGERPGASRTPLLDEIWPARSVGPWPKGLVLRREDLYD